MEFSPHSAAFDFSRYSNFPDEYHDEDEYMEMASGFGDDESSVIDKRELDLREQLLRGAEYEDELELGGGLEDQMMMDEDIDDYWESGSECSSTGLTMSSAATQSDSMRKGGEWKGTSENGSEYSRDTESEDEGPLAKRERKESGVEGGKKPAYLLSASTEMLRIRFPFQSISVRLSDFLCLQENDFLNDTIIDFYLNHIVEHLLPDEPDRRVTVLPSVFWHNLSLRQNSLSEEFEGLSEREKERERFSDILEFVADFELIDVDYVVVPVNEWEHWSLILLCHPFTPSARMLCFDSQLAVDPNNLQQAAALVAEFTRFAYREIRQVSECPDLPIMVPINLAQQENNIDCGLYVLEYARRFLLDPPKKMADPLDFSLLYGDFAVADKRSEMQRVILSLCANRPLWEKLLSLIEPARILH